MVADHFPAQSNGTIGTIHWGRLRNGQFKAVLIDHTSLDVDGYRMGVFVISGVKRVQ